MRSRTWAAPLLAGLMHAALSIAASPPFNLYWLVFLAVVPLVWLLHRPSGRPWRDGALLMLGVAPMWLLWEWWMVDVTAPGFPFFILLQCSWTALFYAVGRRLAGAWGRGAWVVVLPCAWVAVEFFRGEVFLSGYAAALLAYPLVEWPLLAAPAVWLGVYFVSFLAAVVGCALVALVRGGRDRAAGLAAIAGAVVVWVASIPAWRAAAPAPDARAVVPGVVQTNLPQNNKLAWSLADEIDDWERFSRLTAALAHSEPSPDFIIWPETMMPGDTLQRESIDALLESGLGLMLPNGEVLPPDVFYRALMDLQSTVGVPMIVGDDALVNMKVDRSGDRPRTTWDARYNSAYLVHNGAVQGARYDKVRLTPFGETMPVISRWPWLQNQMLAFGARGMQFNLAAGRDLTVLNVPTPAGEVRVVTPICFEVTVSDHCRALVFEDGARRADLIANLTNDGWFGDSDIARVQHLQIAQWRCVELATPMVRSANTGVSAFIDAQGRLLAQGVEGNRQTSRIDGILRARIALGTRPTLFARVGNVFPWTALGLCAAALAWTFLRKWLPGNRVSASGRV